MFLSLCINVLLYFYHINHNWLQQTKCENKGMNTFARCCVHLFLLPCSLKYIQGIQGFYKNSKTKQDILQKEIKNIIPTIKLPVPQGFSNKTNTKLWVNSPVWQHTLLLTRVLRALMIIYDNLLCTDTPHIICLNAKYSSFWTLKNANVFWELRTAPVEHVILCLAQYTHLTLYTKKKKSG